MYKKIFYLFLLVGILVPFYASAQLPSGVPITITDVESLIEGIANFLISISMVFAVVFIVWAGISYMMAGDDPAKVKGARQKLLTAVIGSLIILGVGVILQTINSIVDRSFFT